MRISDTQLYMQNLRHLTLSRQRNSATQERIASGRQVSKPSDKPTAYHHLEGLKHRQSALDDYDRNASAALRRFQTVESSLQQMFDSVVRARELVTQGSNGTIEAENREQIAAEMSELREHFQQLAATRSNGQYVFSGTGTDRPPLDAAGNYQGGGLGHKVDVGDSAQVELAIDGAALFTGDVDVMATLDGIISDLQNNDTTALSARLDELDQMEDQILSTRTEVGARITRVRVAEDLTSDLRLQMAQEDRDIGDIDYAAQISNLTQQEQTLQAAVSMVGRSLQASLLDVI